MVQRSKIWRFSGLLRWVALVMATLYGVVHIMSWVIVYFEGTGIIFEYYVDRKSSAPLEPWQIIWGIVFSSVLTGAYIYICLAANQFLKTSRHAGFFVEEVITACRKLGYGLMLYWLGLILIENFMPGVMTFNFPEDERVAIEWVPLDHYVILLVGVILLLMAQAMEEAREIDSDNKQFI